MNVNLGGRSTATGGSMGAAPGTGSVSFSRRSSQPPAPPKTGTPFIFDIIVVRVDVPAHTFENPNSLIVDVKFNNADLKITSSRINVVEFRSGRSYEFSATPLELKEDLKKTPLKLTLKYEGKSIGRSELPWPESFVSRISECAGELTLCGEGELKNEEDAKVGSIEVIIRLQTKCKEYTDPDFSLSQMPESICKQMDKVIDPNDILFVVGDDKTACNCAQVGIIPASDSEKSLNPTCLDLSNFRNVNGKTLTSPDILNCLDTMYCSQAQKVSHQYQELMGGTTTRGCRESQPCCSRNALPQLSFGQNKKSFPHCSSSGSGTCSACNNNQDYPKCNICNLPAQFNCPHSNVIPCRCRSDDEAFAGQNVLRITGNDTPPDLTQTTIIKPRCCPLCKANLSWLPKLTACPKCGYKAVPYFEETPFDENVTADDILNDILHRKTSCSDFSSQNDEVEKRECRCTCAGDGKLCAYCRIRKLTEDIFQPPPKTEDCKCERKSSEVYNICETGSNSCRPFLARVFSELRELYDIKDAKQKTKKQNVVCEKTLNPPEKSVNKKQIKTKDQNGNESAVAASNKNNGKKSTADASGETKELTEVEQRKRALYRRLNKNKKMKKKLYDKERKKFLVKNFKKDQSACKSKTYTFGLVRPEIPKPKTCHKTCVNGFAAGRKNVPPNMGWLWNLEAKGSRAGWKPGAIRRPIKQLMKYFLKDFPADTIRVSQYAYRKKEEKEKCELVQKPTLHIFKKNGEYIITLRPLKDPDALKQCADPYLDMKPIQFRIVKNPIVLEMRKLKRCLKDMGFKKCTCHKPIIYCYCRSFLDKKRLEYQCNKESHKRCLPSVTDQLVLSDTTDSDVEFDFGVTPPAGVIKLDRLKKPDLINHGTQYVEGDWNVPPMYPREPNKYMKLYNCAIGERYGKSLTPYGEAGYGPGAKVDPCALARRGGKFGKGKGGTDFLKPKGGAEDGKDGKRGKDGKDRKVDMLKYLQQKNKEAKKSGKKPRRPTTEMAPPLLCMVDRRGKPFDPCGPCLPCAPCDPCSPLCYGDGTCNRLFDPRIC